MKKISAVLLSVLVLMLALTACGGSSLDINTVEAAVEAACPIENPIAYTDDDLTYDMSINMDDVDSYVGNHTGTNGASGSVLVIKAKSGKADAIKTALETYVQNTAAFLGNYEEFAAAQQQAAQGRVVVSGDVVILAIASEGVDYSAVDTAIADATK